MNKRSVGSYGPSDTRLAWYRVGTEPPWPKGIVPIPIGFVWLFMSIFGSRQVDVDTRELPFLVAFLMMLGPLCVSLLYVLRFAYRTQLKLVFSDEQIFAHGRIPASESGQRSHVFQHADVSVEGGSLGPPARVRFAESTFDLWPAMVPAKATTKSVIEHYVFANVVTALRAFASRR